MKTVVSSVAILLFLSTSVTTGQDVTTPVRVCDEGEFEKVVITSTGAGICTSEPCLFEKGSNITMDITFEAKERVDSFSGRVSVSVNSAPEFTLPLPGIIAGCPLLYNTVCPLDQDERVVYRVNLPLGKYIPDVNTNVGIKFALLNDANEHVMTCFKVNAHTQKI